MTFRIGYEAKRVFHNSTGLGNYSRSLIAVLSKDQKDNKFLLYNPSPPKIKFAPKRKNIEMKMPTGLWKFFASIWRLGPVRKDIKEDQIDLFHGLSGELPSRLPCPSVVTVHDLIFFKHPQYYKPIDVLIHKKKLRHAIRSANKVVAVSEETKQDLIRYVSLAEEKIQVIYQGCHPQFLQKHSAQDQQRVLEKYNLPKKFILSVGTLEKRKNAMLLLQAIVATQDQLVLVGRKTSYQTEINAFISKNKLQSRVHFIHNILFQELPVLYQAATIFCYPSFSEGFGIPVLEALCSGVPVIAAAGGCLEEAGGPDSVYIDPKNAKELEYKIAEVQKNSEIREKMIRRGYDHSAKFSDQIIAEQWNTLYQQMISKG